MRPAARIDSVILRTAVRLVLPLTVLVAVYAAFQGHNAPGGGFIAGLVVAIGLSTHRMAFGQRAFHRLLPVHPRWIPGGTPVDPRWYPGGPRVESTVAAVYNQPENVENLE